MIKAVKIQFSFMNSLQNISGSIQSDAILQSHAVLVPFHRVALGGREIGYLFLCKNEYPGAYQY